MTADLFLTCFLACLFAFVVFGVLGWQIAAFLIRRAVVKHMPDIIEKALHSMSGAPHSNDAEVFAELMKIAKQAPPGVVPHLPTVTCLCGHAQDVPPELPLSPYLNNLGWKFAMERNGWHCPKCAGASLRAV